MGVARGDRAGGADREGWVTGHRGRSPVTHPSVAPVTSSPTPTTGGHGSFLASLLQGVSLEVNSNPLRFPLMLTPWLCAQVTADRPEVSDVRGREVERDSELERELQVRRGGMNHGVFESESVVDTATSKAPLQNPPSFLSKILQSQWNLGQKSKSQFRGGWVVLPRRVGDLGLAAAAEQVEWPMPGGSASVPHPPHSSTISYAEVIMAGRGDWRGRGRGGYEAGRGGWTQPRPAQGEWRPQATPLGAQVGGGQFAQGFGDPGQQGQSFVGPGGGGQGALGYGYGAQFGAPEQRPPMMQGGYGQGDFFGYNNGFQFQNQGINGTFPSVPSSSGGFIGQNSRPAGGFVQQIRGVANNSGGSSMCGQSMLPTAQANLPSINQVPAKMNAGQCYRCGESGHGIKECKAVVFCEICAKSTHITSNCVLPNQPKPVAALIGCGGEGLQMFAALTGKKIDPDKAKQSIALVSVHSGNVDVQQLVDSFSKMFQWGWDWKARPYMANSFLVKFPSAQKIEELKGYEYFGLPGLNSAVRVSKWDNAAMVKFKLYVVWVRISGIPESLLHYHGICEAASLIGKVKEVDMKMFRQNEIVRVKVGVKDPRMIPEAAPLNEDDYIYDIWFEIEDIVEQGGPMLGGALIVNKLPDAPGNINNSFDLARTRDSNMTDDADSSKGNQLEKDTVSSQDRVDEEEVVSSQYELDMRLQAEIAAKNLRNTGSSGFLQSPIACPINAEKFDNERDVNDEEYPEEEVDFSCSEDPDQFARAVGLSTQKIREIDKKIAMEEENKENRNPAVMEVVGQKKQTLGGCNAKAVNNIQFEAQERIRKAKAKAEIDDAVRRRSVRNKKNDDQHAMDKCEDMAKKKNLETVPEKRVAKVTATGG